ncbi:MAG: fhaB 14 [Firmicutes bacterium]|nr:fhaB 14 [Bacillota bacterium]
MPAKMLVFKIIGIILHYGLLVLIYYFLFRLLKIIYREFYVASGKPAEYSSVGAEAVNQEQAKLVVLTTGKVKLSQPVFILGDTASIGRGANNTIVVDENFISHEHACITKYKHEFWVTDLQSTNGTFINDIRVKDDVVLKPGDVVRIGSVSFRFER